MKKKFIPEPISLGADASFAQDQTLVRGSMFRWRKFKSAVVDVMNWELQKTWAWSLIYFYDALDEYIANKLPHLTVGVADSWANYIVDWVADNVEISQAAAAMSALWWGTIIILAWEYNIASTIVPQSNVNVIWVNNASVVLKKSANVDIIWIWSWKHNITIADMTFDGNGFNSANEWIQYTGCEYLTIENCVFTDLSIWVRGDANNTTIKNNGFYNNVRQWLNIAWINVFVHNNIVDWVDEEFGIVMWWYCNGVKIMHNNVKNCPLNWWIQRWYSWEKNIISGNIVEDCWNGIEVWWREANSYNYTQEVRISNNYIRWCDNGIIAQRKDIAAVWHVMKDVDIDGNTIFDCVSWVMLWPIDSGVVVHNNTIHDCTYGVRSILSTIPDVDINNNTFYNITSQAIATSSNWWAVRYNTFRDITYDCYINNDGADYEFIAHNTYTWVGRDFIRNAWTNGVHTGNVNESGWMWFGITTPTNTITLWSLSTGIALHNIASVTTNFEKWSVAWESDIFTIKTQPGGTWSIRPIQIWTFNSSGWTASVLTISRWSLPYLSFTASWTSNAGNVMQMLTSSNSFSASSGTQNILQIAPAIAQTWTANFNIIDINYTETSVWSWWGNFINLRKWSGSPLFTVDRLWAFSCSNTISTSVATPSTHKMALVNNGVTYYVLLAT